MPKLRFHPEQRAMLLKELDSDRVLSIYRDGLPTSATQQVSANGYVDGTLKRVAKYLVTLLVPAIQGTSETPAEFEARKHDYEGGRKSSLYPVETPSDVAAHWAEVYEKEFTVSIAFAYWRVVPDRLSRLFILSFAQIHLELRPSRSASHRLPKPARQSTGRFGIFSRRSTPDRALVRLVTQRLGEPAHQRCSRPQRSLNYLAGEPKPRNATHLRCQSASPTSRKK